jgi:NADPH:quinone reductase-like Zn-dependent oxidoreductase
MKAIIHESYGRPDVLALRNVDTPTIADDQVLVLCLRRRSTRSSGTA